MPHSEAASIEEFSIANEFAGVRVRKVNTAQGERLELLVPRTGVSTLLDAMQLEAIVGITAPQFSELLSRLLENKNSSH